MSAAAAVAEPEPASAGERGEPAAAAAAVGAAACCEPGHEVILLGLGCYWCSEKLLEALPGVVSTCVGFAGPSACLAVVPAVAVAVQLAWPLTHDTVCFLCGSCARACQ